MRGFVAFLLICVMAGGLLWLSSCDPRLDTPPGQPMATDTPRPNIYPLILGDLNARATAQEASRLVQDANNQAQVYQAAQTLQAQQVLDEAQRTAVQQTAAAAALTRQAENTATQQALYILNLTVTADMARGTADAQRTATADIYTQTSIANDVRLTQAASESIMDTLRLAKQRAELQNEALAKGPIYLTILALVAILVVGAISLVKYWKKPIVIPRSAWGDAPLLWDNRDDLIDADRLPAGLTRILKHLVSVPQLAAPDAQERTTARDQQVDLTTRGIPGQPTAPRNSPRPAAGTTLLAPPMAGMNYRIFLPDETPPELQDENKMQALDGEWKEVK